VLHAIAIPFETENGMFHHNVKHVAVTNGPRAEWREINEVSAYWEEQASAITYH
jgi:hypothetical protein